MSEINENSMCKFEYCFAVTDQHVVIPIKVVDVRVIEGDIEVTTEIVGEYNSHAECHHKHYFKAFWLDEDGLPSKSNVFVDQSKAIDRAVKQAEEQHELYQGKIDSLTKTLKGLKEDRCAIANQLESRGLPKELISAQESSEALNADVDCVRNDVINTFTEEELAALDDFDAFFNDVDVTNGYEEGWEDNKGELKPFYKVVWDEFKAGNLKFGD